MLTIYRGARAEELLWRLAQEREQRLPADPMFTEVICVPTRGLERWLTQQLAVLPDGPHGICANVDFVLLNKLVFDIARIGLPGDDDSWARNKLAWAVARAIDENRGQEWLSPVNKQLEAARSRSEFNRIKTVQYIRDLFDLYHWQRPAMIRSWHADMDVDGVGEPVVTRAVWQPRLWRAVREIIDQPSPPELLESLPARLQQAVDSSLLPAHISIFELTRLPIGQLELICRLADVIDVDLYALHPSPQLWDSVEQSSDAPSRPLARDAHAVHCHNDILASWSRDAIELQLGLQLLNPAATTNSIDVTVPGERDPETDLEIVQRAIVGNRADVPKLLKDSSISIHGCHGPRRQVDVLRESILHAMAADETLEPRDIVVMCPDVDTYASHIQAVFHDDQQLPVRLADRAPLGTNPFLVALDALLELADARCTSAEVLGLLSLEPIRRRFGIDDESMSRVQQWIDVAGIRWGIDAASRRSAGVGDVSSNSWSAGVDRLVLGAAMADEGLRVVGQTRPIDDVTSSDLELVANLCEFLDAVGATIEAFSQPLSIAEAVTVATNAVDALMRAEPVDEWMLTATIQVLCDIADSAGSVHADSMRVGPTDFRDVLAESVRGRPVRQNFRSGAITFATLTPMRSVPYSVVCLLGMDDAVFPRVGSLMGDDLCRTDPLIGDHDPRAQDRQLLLDAVMAAHKRLIVTFTSRDERTNEDLHPCVPIAELCAVLERGRAADDAVVVQHPLQPFDARNFTPDALGISGSWSYTERDLAACRATRAPHQPSQFLTQPLSAEVPSRVDLRDVELFLAHPVRTFFRDRLRLGVEDREEELATDLPLEVSGLDQWALGQELLSELSRVDAASVGDVAQRWRHATRAAGVLPVGELGDQPLSDVSALATAIDEIRRRVDGTSTRPRLVRLQDVVPPVTGVASVTENNTVLATTMSRVLGKTKNGGVYRVAKHVLPVWLRVVALSVMTGQPVSGVLIGRGPWGGQESVACIRFTSPPDPNKLLTDVLGWYLESLRHPLPIFPEASSAYAHADSRVRREAVDAVWTSEYNFRREDVDPFHVRAFGSIETDDLITHSEFVAYASELWQPVIEASTIDRFPL